MAHAAHVRDCSWRFKTYLGVMADRLSPAAAVVLNGALHTTVYLLGGGHTTVMDALCGTTARPQAVPALARWVERVGWHTMLGAAPVCGITSVDRDTALVAALVSDVGVLRQTFSVFPPQLRESITTNAPEASTALLRDLFRLASYGPDWTSEADREVERVMRVVQELTHRYWQPTADVAVAMARAGRLTALARSALPGEGGEDPTVGASRPDGTDAVDDESDPEAAWLVPHTACTRLPF